MSIVTTPTTTASALATHQQDHPLPAGHKGITTGLLVVLALLSALAPFATDLYLPAFPVMTGELNTTATSVQLTLTAFLVGIAIGQLIFGPCRTGSGAFVPS